MTLLIDKNGSQNPVILSLLDIPHLNKNCVCFFSFTVTLEFRTYVPNGILFFAADTVTSSIKNYFCLFLRNGKLTFSMATSKPDDRTKSITLAKVYNNGQWHSVSKDRKHSLRF